MKSAFLFGAGAEADFNICSGNEFAKNVLGIEKSKAQSCINSVIKKYYTNILENCKNSAEHPDWYPTKCYTKQFDIDMLLKNSIKKQWFEQNKKTSSISNFEKDVYREASAIKSIKEKREIIYRTPNYMGILDENFHTIIAPRSLGPNKFWSVVMAITRAYLAVCSGLLSIPLSSISNNLGGKLRSILENPQATYAEVISSINDTSGKFRKESYYSDLKSIFADSKIKADIITTNYTPVAEEIIGLEQIGRISYIHGHIKLFESPYYLQVMDISDNFNREKFMIELNFPFLFLQSGVKPIVEYRQLSAFSMALSILCDCNVLFILGYDFNCDDNHINSLLHTFLHQKNNQTEERSKKIVFFDYCNNEIDRKKPEIRIDELLNRLRIPQNNRHGISKVNFEMVAINGTNAKQVFRETIGRYLNM